MNGKDLAAIDCAPQPPVTHVAWIEASACSVGNLLTTSIAIAGVNHVARLPPLSMVERDACFMSDDGVTERDLLHSGLFAKQLLCQDETTTSDRVLFVMKIINSGGIVELTDIAKLQDVKGSFL